MPFHHIISYRWKEKKWWRKIPVLLLPSIKDCVFKLFWKWLILFFRKFPIISHSCYTKWDDFSGFRWLMRWGETILLRPRSWQGKLIVVHSVRRTDGKRRSHWNSRFKWQVKKERRNLWSKKSSLDLKLVTFLSVFNNSRKHYADILARRKGKEPKAELG